MMRPRIVFFVTRDIEPSISRLNTMKGIRDVLSESGTVDVVRINTIFSSMSVSSLLKLVFLYVGNALTGNFEAFQNLLFCDCREVERAIGLIEGGKYDTVYLDSVRLYFLLREIRLRNLRVRVLMDFDDLLSRRAEEFLALKRPFSFGQYAAMIPKWVQTLIERTKVGEIVTRYEAATLRIAERKAVALSDVVTLVSSREAEELRGRLDSDLKRRVIVIAPPIPVPSRVTQQVERPLRFVFVGPDSQPQNELAIRFLLDLWKSHQPKHRLHIYGKQGLKWPTVDNVEWHGFVENLADAYDETALVLAHFSYPGGIKTKVIEAWSYGRPVLCTPHGIEGMQIDRYELSREESDWGSLILNVEDSIELWQHARRRGVNFVVMQSRIFAERWTAALKAGEGDVMSTSSQVRELVKSTAC